MHEETPPEAIRQGLEEIYLGVELCCCFPGFERFTGRFLGLRLPHRNRLRRGTSAPWLDVVLLMMVSCDSWNQRLRR